MSDIRRKPSATIAPLKPGVLSATVTGDLRLHARHNRAVIADVVAACAIEDANVIVRFDGEVDSAALGWLLALASKVQAAGYRAVLVADAATRALVASIGVASLLVVCESEREAQLVLSRPPSSVSMRSSIFA